jgi:hypothetical protein
MISTATGTAENEGWRPGNFGLIEGIKINKDGSDRKTVGNP